MPWERGLRGTGLKREVGPAIRRSLRRGSRGCGLRAAIYGTLCFTKLGLRHYRQTQSGCLPFWRWFDDPRLKVIGAEDLDQMRPFLRREMLKLGDRLDRDARHDFLEICLRYGPPTESGI